MSNIWNFLIWLADLLDPINSLIGLATTIIAGFTGFLVWRESRRHRRWWQEIRQQPGKRPAILVLDLLPGVNTRAQVENFRQQQEHLRDIPDDRIAVVERQEKLLPEHMPDLQRELHEKVNLLKAAGADRIHLFLAAPQPATAVAGAILASSATTLYHHDRELGTYVNYGQLRGYF